jgi:hypothetical protein
MVEGEQVLIFIHAVTISIKGWNGRTTEQRRENFQWQFYILLSPFITPIKVDIIGIT